MSSSLFHINVARNSTSHLVPHVISTHFPGPPNPSDPLTLLTGWAEFGRAGEPQPLSMPLAAALLEEKMEPVWRTGPMQIMQPGKEGHVVLLLLSNNLEGFWLCVLFESWCCHWVTSIAVGHRSTCKRDQTAMLHFMYLCEKATEKKKKRLIAIYSRNTGSDEWNTGSDHLQLLKGSIHIAYEKRC